MTPGFTYAIAINYSGTQCGSTQMSKSTFLINVEIKWNTVFMYLKPCIWCYFMERCKALGLRRIKTKFWWPIYKAEGAPFSNFKVHAFSIWRESLFLLFLSLLYPWRGNLNYHVTHHTFPSLGEKRHGQRISDTGTHCLASHMWAW